MALCCMIFLVYAGEFPACHPQVQSIIERVIVFLLSQIVERPSPAEALFSLHPRTESCKLLWRDSQAVGFYTVKHKGGMKENKGEGFNLFLTLRIIIRKIEFKYTSAVLGSLCDGWSSCCYLLPVLDTVLVRKSCRRRGFGLLMLQDFCSSFSTEEFLGVSSPLSSSMVAGQLRSPFSLFSRTLIPFLPSFLQLLHRW